MSSPENDTRRVLKLKQMMEDAKRHGNGTRFYIVKELYDKALEELKNENGF